MTGTAGSNIARSDACSRLLVGVLGVHKWKMLGWVYDCTGVKDELPTAERMSEEAPVVIGVQQNSKSPGHAREKSGISRNVLRAGILAGSISYAENSGER